MTSQKNQFGNYELVREVGRGSSSVVYEALDTRLGRTVALKMLTIPTHLSAEAKKRYTIRFRREARTLSRVLHPNVVSIFDVGEINGRQYLVMEYVKGVTLRERLGSGPVSMALAAVIVDQVAAGLDAVHTAGVLHRDIKPVNIMLLPENQIKLMDFGIARQQEDETATQVDMMIGTPAYISPEQIDGGGVTPASDIWALGILLYEMLTGQRPFPGSTSLEILHQVLYDEPIPPPGIPAHIAGVISRALVKDPAQRYETAGALALAFRAASAAPADFSAPSQNNTAKDPQPVEGHEAGLEGFPVMIAAAASQPPTGTHLPWRSAAEDAGNNQGGHHRPGQNGWDPVSNLRGAVGQESETKMPQNEEEENERLPALDSASQPLATEEDDPLPPALAQRGEPFERLANVGGDGKERQREPRFRSHARLAALVAVAAIVLLFVLQRADILSLGRQADGGVVEQPLTLPPSPIVNPFTIKGLPDPALTPGETATTAKVPAATTDASIPYSIQNRVFTSYGINPGSGRYVLCRLIPTALQGTDTPANLFPATPWFAGLKARLDRYLAQQVASGKMTLEQAQKELTEDWIAASHRYYIRNYGHTDEEKARRIEEQVPW